MSKKKVFHSKPYDKEQCKALILKSIEKQKSRDQEIAERGVKVSESDDGR